MKALVAADLIRQAIQNPVQTWLDYTPKDTPMVVYDEDDFIFINHPNPPTERPDLTAATAMEINGIRTATIPSLVCEDGQSLVPLAYHECFHVYQNIAFRFTGEYDFFEVLAFYPELNYPYRALCSAETNVVSNTRLSNHERAQYLSTLTRMRHEILSRHKGLLEFEKDLERNEGVASFVEQKARTKIYGMLPDNSISYYNYSRQYFLGPAICWILEEFYPDNKWQHSIETGTSPTDCLMQAISSYTAKLEDLDLSRIEAKEQIAAETALANANEKIDNLLEGEMVRIKLPDKAHVFRSFSPRSIISLGDGRLIHQEFVIIQVPNGRIEINGDIVLEDFNQRTVVCRAIPYRIYDGILKIETSTVRIQLSNVKQTQENEFEAL